MPAEGRAVPRLLPARSMHVAQQVEHRTRTDECDADESQTADRIAEREVLQHVRMHAHMHADYHTG